MRIQYFTAKPIIGTLVVGVLSAAPNPGASQTASVRREVDQQTIAKQLLSENKEERGHALAVARAIGPSATGPALRAGLIALLEKLNELVRKAERDGIPVEKLENPEFIVGVQEMVARLREPKAIPALAEALGTFATVRALVAFGEQAVPAVVGVVTSATIHHSAVDDGLIVLRWIVERRGTELSSGTIAQIRRTAEQRLTGEQSFTTLWYAIDLAAVLGDEDLRRIIADLATNPGDVIARGVTDPRLAEKTRERARERLAGVPARPRPEP